MEHLSGNNITEILIAVIGLAGIVYQAYCSKTHKRDKEDQTKTLEQAINRVEDKADAAAQNAKNANENILEVKEKLGINDRVTVSAVRQQIRQMYYAHKKEKQLSLVDYRALNEMYNAYKAVTLPDGHHPNSWCDALYEEMSGWERVEEYPDYKDKEK